jgi:hypothetical protein
MLVGVGLMSRTGRPHERIIGTMEQRADLIQVMMKKIMDRMMHFPSDQQRVHHD